MIIKWIIAGLAILTIGLVSSSVTASPKLSSRLQQTCAPALRSAEQTAAANGLLCNIWTDPDCRALAVQKGILTPACAFPKIQAPIRRPE